MLGFSILAVTIAVTLTGLAVLCVVTNDPTLQPATVNPFAGPLPADPAGETLAMGSVTDPTLAGDWKQVELDSLADVEELLDALEAQHVRHQEMDILGNDKFVVRWR